MVFQHNARLPEVIRRAMAEAGVSSVSGACASVKPRPAEGSYMPAFTVGEGYARAIAAASGVPFHPTTHQEGHLRAARIGSAFDPEGRSLALHLSGGTTELLLLEGSSVTRLGATGDLSAGQFVDRIGVALGLSFPAGPALDALAAKAHPRSLIPATMRAGAVHFSGAEACALRLIASGETPEAVAAEALSLINRTLAKWIAWGASEAGADRALLFGGVAGSLRLREGLGARFAMLGVSVALHWAMPEYAGDNAAGVALIGWEALREGGPCDGNG
ncbi:MAG: hypothetical protein FWF90_03270 [Promicromonosporaceae bacterium]|nr:hypothetical protein [Promicromonosporaceae bacterium]